MAPREFLSKNERRERNGRRMLIAAIVLSPPTFYLIYWLVWYYVGIQLVEFVR